MTSYRRNTPWKWLLISGSLMFAGMLCASNPIWQISAFDGRIEAAVFSADTSRVACRMADGRVLLRDLEHPSASQAFSTRPFAVPQISISDDGHHLVWSDTSGMLYHWSVASGLSTKSLPDDSPSGLVLSGDGTTIGTVGNGIYGRISKAEDLSQIAVRSTQLEQAMALACNHDGSEFLVVDHKGKLAGFSRNRSAVQRVSMNIETPAGIRHVGLNPVDWALWDINGKFLLLSDSLDVINTIESGIQDITAVLIDKTGEQLLVGNAGGGIHSIALDTGSISDVSTPPLGEAVAGIGMLPDSRLIAITEFGGVYVTLPEGGWELQESGLRGNVLRAHTSLQAGIGTVVTDQETLSFNLHDGSANPVIAGPEDIVLDTAILNGTRGSSTVALLMNRETLEVRLTGEALPEPVILDEDWMPTRIASDPWQERLALMSMDGRVRILEEQAGELEVVQNLGPEADNRWEDLTFINEDPGISRIREATTDSFTSPDGPFKLVRVAGGILSFDAVESAPAFQAWPDLVPAPESGMDSGYLGNLKAIKDTWVYQREYGWGYYLNAGDITYFHYQDVGWLAGSPDLASYLFAFNRNNWIHTLVADYPTDWIYDFASGTWQRFGQ